MSRLALLALVSVLACGAALAQQPQDERWTLKPLIPPVLPLPPTTQMDAATVGTPQGPATTAPLQSPTPSQSAPGMRLSIPTR